jgi:Flp pilus assembly protein TadD
MKTAVRNPGGKSAFPPAAPAVAKTKEVPPTLWTLTRVSVLLLVLGFAVFANGLNAPFVFDMEYVVDNPSFRHLWPPDQLGEGSRPIVDYTFAIDYALNGHRPLGYHIFNLFIHWLAACLMFFIVREILRRGPVPESVQQAASGLAAATAAAWLVHPLQTNVVTSVVQRYESLMGLFYVATFACFLRALVADRKRMWYVASVVCCFIGMACKEVMATAPLLVLIYDYFFVTNDVKRLWRERGAYYTGLATSWIWFAYLLHRAAPGWEEGGVATSSKVVTPWQYLLTQAEVIPYYWLLIAWPRNLCLDYGWPFVESLEHVILPGAAVCIALGAAVYGIWLRRLWGFSCLIFFVVLAPTSTFVPILDAIFEHRLYLPLAPALALLIVGGFALLNSRWPHLSAVVHPAIMRYAMMMLVGLLALGTVLRNFDYADPLYVYQQGINRNSRYPRNYANAGVQLSLRGRPNEAIPYFLAAIQLAPATASLHRGLAEAYLDTGSVSLAYDELFVALQLAPDDHESLNDMGLVLMQLKQYDAARDYFERAIAIKPDYAPTYNNLGLVALHGERDRHKAEQYFRKATELSPGLEQAEKNLKSLKQAAQSAI